MHEAFAARFRLLRSVGKNAFAEGGFGGITAAGSAAADSAAGTAAARDTTPGASDWGEALKNRPTSSC